MITSALRPTQLSKYELREEIGHGGMATVYRARDTRLERDVALKLLHPHLRENAEVKVRFASEARAVAKLRHPNIVEVFDVSDDDEPERYLVVELVNGITLRQLLKEQTLSGHRPLPVELAAEIVLEVGGALEHAHEQGVIHRDIKPENVLIEAPRSGGRSTVDDFDRARIKLTDFGIAKLLDVEGVTSTGQVLGSPAHMAPEQIEGRSVDGRADVFSLGVLFYECITGQLPFAGKNPAQVLRNVLEGTFSAADTLEPRVGARWAAIVSKALKREPAARYQSIADFTAAIRSELTSLGFTQTRRDITEFLVDRQGYSAGFTARIVEALSNNARRARQERDVARASADFGRALVYRPGDPALLAQVSQLKFRDRFRTAAMVSAGLGAVAAVAYLVWPADHSPAANPKRVAPAAPIAAPTAATAPSAPRPAAAAPVSAQPAATRKPDADPAKTARRLPRAANPTSTAGEELAATQTRRVSVRITGAGGGTVKIDGNEVPWFGVIHELTVGSHAFEFLPPNDSCCVATRRTVEVPAGDGLQVVVGSIPFKNATFSIRELEGEGWSVSCPTLFSGQLAAPGRRSIPMSQAEVVGSCVVSSPVQGSAAVQKVVTLRAGQTTTLPWP